MSIHLALAVAALAASIFLLAGPASRLVGAVALLASALEVAMAMRYLRLSVAHVPLGLLLGLCLAVPGLVAWLRAGTKAGITAASVTSLVGLVQVAEAVARRL